MQTTPILVILFNRPDFATKLFQVISELKPPKLYVISDGPRTALEAEAVQKSRDIFNVINWVCEVKKNYSDENLGLRNRISGGISWAFENEERLIILEDDCIPHPDFFPFCDELLTKYKDDTRIMTINGCNLNPDLTRNNSETYFFSKYASSWGWATWKRAWNLYDSEMEGFDNKDVLRNFAYNLPYRYRAASYWYLKLEKVKNAQINSWAYRWMFTLWINNGLAVVPKTNLIQNIGYDMRSTNTKGNLHYINIHTSALKTNKLKSPQFVIANSTYDKWMEDTIFSKSVLNRLKWIVKKIFPIF